MKISTRAAGVVATPGVRAAGMLSRKRGLTILGWHRLGRADDGLTTSLTDFRRQLDMMEDWGATVLGLDEAHRLLALDQLPSRAVALTFDDGYASVLELAWPELKQRGLPATLFAVSGFLDANADRRFPWDGQHSATSKLTRIADIEAVRSAAGDGLDIGSHTVTHRWLPGLTSREIGDEVARSRNDLEDLLNQPVVSFAYPMGGWTWPIRDAVERAGYRYAVTVDRGRNRAGQDPQLLRRAFAFDRAEDVRRQLQGGFTWMRPIERRRSRRAPAW